MATFVQPNFNREFPPLLGTLTRDALEALTLSLMQRALTLTRTNPTPARILGLALGLRDLNELRIDRYRDREKMRRRTVRLQPVISNCSSPFSVLTRSVRWLRKVIRRLGEPR
jgi:hypothetical protein